MTSRWTAQASRLPTASTISRATYVAPRRRLIYVDGGDVGSCSERRLGPSLARGSRGSLRLAGDGRTRDERLEAASLATGAHRTGGIGDDVADLARESVRATMEAAVEDDAGRDAGPDGEIGEVVDLAEDAPAVESEGRGTDVVLEDTRPADGALELLAESQVGPAEVDRQGHRAGQRVDPARHTDADRLDIGRRRAGRAQGRIDDRLDAAGGGGLGSRGDWRDVSCEDPFGAIGHEDRDLRPADIHADEQRPPAVRAVVSVAVVAVATRPSPARPSPSRPRSVIAGPPDRARW